MYVKAKHILYVWSVTLLLPHSRRPPEVEHPRRRIPATKKTLPHYQPERFENNCAHDTNSHLVERVVDLFNLIDYHFQIFGPRVSGTGQSGDEQQGQSRCRQKHRHLQHASELAVDRWNTRPIAQQSACRGFWGLSWRRKIYTRFTDATLLLHVSSHYEKTAPR